MAKANSTHVIPPLPADIDRDAFGHWLSGFVDGEGCFVLQKRQRSKDHAVHTGDASFTIALRWDDVQILELIQSYWRCGVIHYWSNVRSKIPNAKPVAMYVVKNRHDLQNVLVAHFERYPLRAKKKQDFRIWKAGVEFLYRVSIPPAERSAHRDSSGRILPIWNKEDRSYFLSLVNSLKAGRAYRPIAKPRRASVKPSP